VRHRILHHTGIAARDRVGIKPGHRRQPASDGARRQPRLPITKPHHAAITPLIGEKLKHIRRQHIARILDDHGEKRLQIKGHRPNRVRPSPARNELQIPINQRIAKPIPRLPRHRSPAHQTRKRSHHRTLAAPGMPARNDTNITRVLSGTEHCDDHDHV
jgi:hypothetical protein